MKDTMASPQQPQSKKEVLIGISERTHQQVTTLHLLERVNMAAAKSKMVFPALFVRRHGGESKTGESMEGYVRYGKSRTPLMRGNAYQCQFSPSWGAIAHVDEERGYLRRRVNRAAEENEKWAPCSLETLER